MQVKAKPGLTLEVDIEVCLFKISFQVNWTKTCHDESTSIT